MCGKRLQASGFKSPGANPCCTYNSLSPQEGVTHRLVFYLYVEVRLTPGPESWGQKGRVWEDTNGNESVDRQVTGPKNFGKMSLLSRTSL